jgi:hypothetical protein
LKYGIFQGTLADVDSALFLRVLGALAHESRLAIFRAPVVASDRLNACGGKP